MDFTFLLISTIIALALLGLIVAFSPTLIITEIAILTKSKKPLIHTASFIAGIAAAVTVFSLLSFLFIDSTQDFSLPGSNWSIDSIPLIDIIVGTILILLGVKLARKNPASEKSRSLFSPDNLLSAKTLFWFGLLKMATCLSSIAAILYASRYIQAEIHNQSQQIIALMWLLVISITPFVLIAGLENFRPDVFRRIKSSSESVTKVDWQRYLVITLLILGFYLVLTGLLNRN